MNKFPALRCLLIILGLSIFLPHPVQADEISDLQKQIMLSQKKLVVMDNMTFTPEEATAFWPLYEELQEELFSINKKTAGLILAFADSYQTLTDTQADQIVSDIVKIKQDRLDAMKSYLRKIGKILPAKKVLRFYQIENKLAAAGRFEIAKEIPLAK